LFAQASEALVAGDRQHPGAELRVAAEQVKVAIDLDRGLLRGVLGLGLVSQQPQQQKVNGALRGPDEGVKKMLLASQDAADTVGLEFGLESGRG